MNSHTFVLLMRLNIAEMIMRPSSPDLGAEWLGFGRLSVLAILLPPHNCGLYSWPAWGSTRLVKVDENSKLNKNGKQIIIITHTRKLSELKVVKCIKGFRNVYSSRA